MKRLTDEITEPFLKEINDLCQKYSVLITAHCTWVGYGENGDAAHNISNAGSDETSAAKAEECLKWYRDGNFREHYRQ